MSWWINWPRRKLKEQRKRPFSDTHVRLQNPLPDILSFLLIENTLKANSPSDRDLFL